MQKKPHTRRLRGVVGKVAKLKTWSLLAYALLMAQRRVYKVQVAKAEASQSATNQSKKPPTIQHEVHRLKINIFFIKELKSTWFLSFWSQ